MDYISLGISAVMAMFLIVGFLFGFKRGAKRTLVRSIWIIIAIVVAFLISYNLTHIVLDMKLNITISGQKFETIKVYLNHLLQDAIDVDGGNYEAITEVVVGLVALVVNVVLFVLGYFIIKIITLLPYWISNIFIFAGERRRKKRAKKEKTKIKIKKHRLAGAIIGMVLGFMSFCVVMTPIVGYVNIAKSVESRTLDENNKGVLYELGGDTYTKLINQYDDSVAVKVMDSLYIDKALGGAFNSITSTKINDQKVKLYDEAMVAADAYNIYKEMNVPNLDKVTQAELNTFLESAEALTNKIFESKIITTSADAVIPFVAKFIKQSIDTSEYKYYVLNLYNAFFDQFEGFNSVTTQEEVINAIGVIKILNNNNLFLPIVQDKTGDIAEYLQNNLTKEASDEIVDGLFKLKTVNNMAPAVVNFMLGYGSEELGYKYDEEQSVLASTLRSCSKNILHSVVDLLSTYDSDTTTKVEINELTVSALGRIFDEIGILVSTRNFKSIINSVEPDLEEIALETLNAQPQFLKNSVNKAILNISEIRDFEKTFVDLYRAYNIVKTEFDKAGIEIPFNQMDVHIKHD